MTDVRILCGTAPDSDERRRSDEAGRRWQLHDGLQAGPLLLQLIPNIRNQRRFGSCAGQSFGMAIEQQIANGPHLMLRPEVSGVSLWREARRRAGLPLTDPAQGTRFQDVVDGLINRGWDQYHEGEDSDLEEAGVGAPEAGDDLADELFAHDTKKRVVDVYRITGSGEVLLDGIDGALSSGAGVAWATGCRAEFFGLGKNETATREHLGGNYNGHGMRIAGRQVVDGRRLYIVQNSWGMSWGGCDIEGDYFPGCCLVSAEAIADGWDQYAVVVR